MFDITTYHFSNDYQMKDFEKWELPNDFHCLYILENGRDAYVGETLNIRRRAYEHRTEHRDQNFQQIHIITGNFMEASPAKHYEKLLIRLMKADGLFHIVNKIDGNQTHYARRNEFELLFDRLWDQLATKKLVKIKEFQFILNTNAYKYSPYTTLNEEQAKALNHIVSVLTTNETAPSLKKYKRRPILITGRAGTGKTVVASSLFHYLRNNNTFKTKTIAWVVANEQLRTMLQRVFQNIGEGLHKSDIVSPIELTKRHYDIVICDETHALRRGVGLVSYNKNFKLGNSRLGFDDNHDELDWILAQSDVQILFYDPKQTSKRSDILDDNVRKCIHDNPHRGYREIELKAQMRIKAGDSYISYIYDILNQNTPTIQLFEQYDFRLFSSFKKMRNQLLQKEKQMGLCKLCAGYAWPWISKDDKSLYDILIEGIGIRWNRDKKNWIGNVNSKYEMGSIYTLRGIDLNYVGLVIGPDLYLDEKDGKIKVRRTSLYSNDVKKGASEKELLRYVLNIYAILFTRAIEGTYVYVCDDALREYFAKYIKLT